MNRKTQSLNLRRSVTPKAIDLKFGVRDYVVGVTQQAKTYNNRPSRDPWKRGEICFFYFFGDFLPGSREQMERHIALIFLHQMTCFAGD